MTDVMVLTKGEAGMALPKSFFLAAIGVTCLSIGSAFAGGPAKWKRHAGAYGPIEGYVVAESRFGHGTVSGPVRRTPTGYEVRMPGGTWIQCRRSCSETLRVETVDFWENRGAGRDAIDTECGLLGCLRWERSF